MRDELLKVIEGIDRQIAEVEKTAASWEVLGEVGIDPHRLRDSNGQGLLAPLLIAKAQALGVLARDEITVPSAAVTAEPGDRVIITFSARISQDVAHMVRERLHEIIPDVDFAIVDGISAIAVVKGGAS